MAPPPSQAGKFKPRKPGKKIAKPGQPAGSSQAQAPENTPSSLSQHAGRSAERGGRGRGRSRGQRGGGRGRMPLPRGQVFFTGQPDPKKAGTASGINRKRSTTTSATSGSGATRSDRPGGNEEILGTLDQGVGANMPKSSSKSEKLSTTKSDQADFFEEEDRAPITKIKASAMYYSDSDSSDEENVKRKPMKIQEDDARQPISSVFPEQATAKTAYFGQEELKEGWFLLQLPTRLLQLTKHEVEDVTEGKDDAEVEVLTGVETAPVSVKPVVNGVFDNVLSKAPAGKVGKLRVYRSGRTELVMGDGVILDVSEGLSCSFRQSAVAVDLDHARYVPMGHVKETFVATPKIE